MSTVHAAFVGMSDGDAERLQIVNPYMSYLTSERLNRRRNGRPPGQAPEDRWGLPLAKVGGRPSMYFLLGKPKSWMAGLRRP